MSTFWTPPRVFISYTWRPEENKQRAFELAERLRREGLDARIDVYFQQTKHGFTTPQPVLGDPRNPWVVWAETEIRQSDCVLLLCTDEYTATDRGHESFTDSWQYWNSLDHDQKLQTPVPYVWWDWHAMHSDWQSGNASGSKYVPCGFGRYEDNKRNIPAFLGGATYCNLESESDFAGMLRRIRVEHRKRHPRAGVFISYAHKDDPTLKTALLERIRRASNDRIQVWTDAEIEPGDRWHDEIQGSIAAAKVAVMLVSPSFLDSDYITQDELPRFIEASQVDGLKFMWIPVIGTDRHKLMQTELARIQSAHPPERPLSELQGSELDRALDAIAEKVIDAHGS